jgi:hypothetical protein
MLNFEHWSFLCKTPCEGFTKGMPLWYNDKSDLLREEASRRQYIWLSSIRAVLGEVAILLDMLRHVA